MLLLILIDWVFVAVWEEDHLRCEEAGFEKISKRRKGRVNNSYSLQDQMDGWMDEGMNDWMNS